VKHFMILCCKCHF